MTLIQLRISSSVFLSDLGFGLEVMLVSEYVRLLISQSRVYEQVLLVCESHSWKNLVDGICFGFCFFSCCSLQQDITGTVCQGKP